MAADNPPTGFARPSARETLAIIALFGSVVGVGMAFAWPWMPAAGAGSAALASYAPLDDGRSTLYARYAADGSVTWESENQQVLLAGRALAAELRKPQRQALEKLYLRPGEQKLEDEELLRRLRSSTLLRIVNRELTPGTGDARSNVAVTVREPRGDFLLGLYDPRHDQDMVFDPAVHTLPTDLAPGRTWESRGKLGGAIDYAFHGRVVKGGEFRPKGTSFPDCRQIETRLVLANGGSTLSDQKWSGWYCAGVGLVDEQTVEGGKTTVHRVAVSAEGMPEAARAAFPASPARPSAPAASGPWQLTRMARIGQTVNASEGTILPVWIPTQPAALLVAGQGSDLTAYDADDPTGAVLWRFHPAGTIYSPPGYDPRTGRIFFGATDKRLYALDSHGLFLWSFATGDNVATRPVVVGDVVVFGSEDRTVYGVDAASGRLRWKRDTGGPVVSSPAVVGRTVVIGSDDGSVYALDAGNGLDRWSYATGAAVEAPVVAAGGTLYVASRDGTLSALDPQTGKPRWTAQVGNVVRSAPAVTRDAVYVVDRYGYVKAFDRAGGRRLWTSPREGYTGAPLVVDGRVYVARSDGAVHRLGPDGERMEEWKGAAPPGGQAPSFWLGLSGGGGSLWLADGSAGVWRLGARTGGAESLGLSWSHMVSEKPFGLQLLTTTPAEWGGRAYLLDRDNNLYEVDPVSGAAVRRTRIVDEHSSMVEPVVTGSTLLAVAGPSVHALRLSDGRTQWTFHGEGTALTPVAVGGGTVLWTTQKSGGGNGSESGTLYALDLATGRLRWSFPVRGVASVGAAVVRGGTIFLGSPAAALDLATGRPLWTARTGGLNVGTPALSPGGDLLYTAVVASDGKEGWISALGAADGRERWRAVLGAGEVLNILDRVWAQGGRVIVPSMSGRVIALDGATGRELWRYTPDAPRLGAITVDGERIYTALQNGQVVVLDAATGRPTARFTDLELNLSAFSYAQRPVRVGGRLIAPTGMALLGFELTSPEKR